MCFSLHCKVRLAKAPPPPIKALLQALKEKNVFKALSFQYQYLSPFTSCEFYSALMIPPLFVCSTEIFFSFVALKILLFSPSLIPLSSQFQQEIKSHTTPFKLLTCHFNLF